MSKLKVLFVYDLLPEHEKFWRDGLFCALKKLDEYFEIVRDNLAAPITGETTKKDQDKKLPYDFVLGWGAFGSRVDLHLQALKRTDNLKIGLCVAGNAKPPMGKQNYDVLFYETEWVGENYLGEHSNKRYAFGINTSIFYPKVCERTPDTEYCPSEAKIWDWITVGAFSTWKRQERLADKKGNKLAIGYIQKDNLEESAQIIGTLLKNGVMISDIVEPEILAKIYGSTENVLVSSDIFGGGERTVWEARMGGCNVEVADDNPKLQELLNKPIMDADFYAKQLLEGINSVL